MIRTAGKVFSKGCGVDMWEINITNQIITFLYSIIMGVIVAALYDWQKAHRITASNSVIRIFFQDITFWIINTFFTFLLLMARCNGEVRGYVIIGEVVGFTLFRLILSRFILPIFIWIFKLKEKITLKYREIMTVFSIWLKEKLRKIYLWTKKLMKKVKIKEKTLESEG